MMSKGKTRHLYEAAVLVVLSHSFSNFTIEHMRTHENRLLPVLKVHFQRIYHILSL